MHRFESTAEATHLRQSLVDEVAVRTRMSARVADAMMATPRELFMPGVDLGTVYEDGPYPIGHGQTISQPTVVAMMSEALGLRPTDRVLEIGTGCGYQTAILARLCGHVYSIEIVEPLAVEVPARLQALGLDNVSLRIGDGYLGWPEAAPFDGIVLTAAPEELPRTLLDQLADGGRLVAPVGPRQWQDLLRITRRGPSLQRESLGAVAFVPMVHAVS